MASVNPSAMLAESLSTFSKAAYQAFAELETQSRLEVARLTAEVREAKLERDKALKEVHTFQAEAQTWKQEIVAAKASLSQAEMTIAHQAETLAARAETITQLRREVAQWKDQSQNWQEHFTRVEQERCAQSSRINELIVEKLQSPQQRTSSTSLVTPKSAKYTNGVNSAPSSTSKRATDIPPPDHKAQPTSTLTSPTDLGTIYITPRSQNGETAPKRIKHTTKPSKSAVQQEQSVPPTHEGGDVFDAGNSSSKKRPRKEHLPAQQQQPHTYKQLEQQPPPVTVRSSTIIRRVQAVVHVKREEESSDESNEPPPQASSSSSSGGSIKKKEESTELQRYLRTPRRILSDDEEEEEDQIAEESGSSPLSGHAKAQENNRRGRLRQRERISYAEDDEDYVDQDEDEDDVDELMMGAEDNHDEVYGTHRVEAHETQRPKKPSRPFVEVPPFKKRKTVAR